MFFRCLRVEIMGRDALHLKFAREKTFVISLRVKSKGIAPNCTRARTPSGRALVGEQLGGHHPVKVRVRAERGSPPTIPLTCGATIGSRAPWRRFWGQSMTQK